MSIKNKKWTIFETYILHQKKKIWYRYFFAKTKTKQFFYIKNNVSCVFLSTLSVDTAYAAGKPKTTKKIPSFNIENINFLPISFKAFGLLETYNTGSTVHPLI